MRDMTEPEERRIREYVNSQSSADDQVTLVQRIGTRKVFGTAHHLYDVRTKDGRWWVITEPTNRYSQDDFEYIDMALTYHLGLRAIFADRGQKDQGDDLPRRLVGAWRRFERAVDAYNDADEAEAFQGVGVICREALLALVRDEAKLVTLNGTEKRPKAASFREWVPLLVRQADPHAEVRHVINRLAAQTWDYVVWLQHYANAEPMHAEIGLDMTAELIGIYGRLTRHEGPSERCSECGSYRPEDASFLSDDGQWINVTACAACAWNSEQSPRATSAEA